MGCFVFDFGQLPAIVICEQPSQADLPSNCWAFAYPLAPIRNLAPCKENLWPLSAKMLKNFFKKKVSVKETTIPNYPAVNLTPSDEDELKNILRSALPNMEAENNPLAWSYDPDLWLSGKLHYLIPQEVATKNDIAEFLKIICDTTLSFPGGPFIWNINSLDNLVFLPTSNAEQKEKAGIFAAIYSSCDEPYKAYCDFVTRFLRQLRKNYHEAIANAENSTQSRTLVAMRAAAQILDFQRSLRAGLVGPSRESIKYFLSDTDEILIERFGEFDRPATQKVKFQCESVSVILPDYVRVSKTADDQINATFAELRSQDPCQSAWIIPKSSAYFWQNSLGRDRG